MKDYWKQILFKYLAIIFIASLIASVFLVLSRKEAVSSDFVSYLTGAKIIRDGQGSKLYELQTQREIQEEITSERNMNILSFKNLPALGVLFIPFTFLSLSVSYKIFLLILIVIQLFLASYVVIIFKDVNYYSVWPYLSFVFYPSFGSIFSGQLSILILLLVFVVYYNLKKRHSLFAGLIAGLFVLKVQYMILTAFFVVLSSRPKTFLKGVIISILAITSVCILASGYTWIFSYPEYLITTEGLAYGSNTNTMVSLYAFLDNWQFTQALGMGKLLFVNSGLLLVLFLFFVIRRGKLAFDVAVSAVVVAGLIFGIHVVNYDLTLVLAPVTLLGSKIRSVFEIKIKSVIVMLLAVSPALIVFSKDYFVSLLLFLVLALLLFPGKWNLNPN
jgi:hypothetical protein